MKRYDNDYGNMIEQPEGEWVRYQDVQAELNTSRIELNEEDMNAWEDFILQVEDEREKMNLTKTDVSRLAFGNDNTYGSILRHERQRAGIKTAERLAGALGLKLVLCLVETDE